MNSIGFQSKTKVPTHLHHNVAAQGKMEGCVAEKLFLEQMSPPEKIIPVTACNAPCRTPPVTLPVVARCWG